VELRHLEYFVTVAEELSFTRASRRLHVVQSGVSSAIQGLERELGALLFERDRHRVALTDAGQALLPEARATLAAAQAAREAVADARGGLRGTVTLGTMLSTGPLDLPGLLGRFHASHPDVAVRLRLASAGSAGLAREVIAGALDLALVSLPGQPPPGLALQFVTAEPLLLVCPPGHPVAARAAATASDTARAAPGDTARAAAGDTAGAAAGHGPGSAAGNSVDDRAGVTLEDLAGEPFIDFPHGWGNRAVVDRAFAAAGIDRQVPFEVADFAAATSLLRNGLGMAFLPASVAMQQPGLTAVELTRPALAWEIYVATPAHRRPSAAARAFLAELLRAAPSSPSSPG
jgi:DNA-binding transcriptional LysR family regulator